MPGPQVIPRPAGWRTGQRSPWAELSPVERRGLSLDRIRRSLRPGPLTDGHPAEHDGREARPAAVLVAVFEETGEAHVVLTRRAATMRSHRHQVAFPGGRIDPGETPEAAAVREAHEEIGLAPDAVELLGPLPGLATLRGLSAIAPFVGVLSSRPELHPNPAEVERAFSVPLTELLADGCHWEERWPFPDGAERAIHFFDLPEDLVWGATARILVSFLCQVLGLAAPHAWP